MPPTTTARPDPSGIKLDDGYRTVFAFSRAPTIGFWEKSVTPPGVDGGDEIDTTTMHNDTVRTRSPRALYTLTEMSATVAWDPKCYSSIVNTLVNEEGSVTVHMPDGSTLDFFGFLRDFIPGEMVEGEQPEATVTIIPTNQDPVTGAESLPVLTEVVGT